MHRRLVNRAVALSVALVVALSACTDGGSPDDATSTSSAGEPTASDEPKNSPSATGETVAPATGPLLSLNVSEVHAPHGWRLFPRSDSGSKSAVEVGGMSLVNLGELDSSGDGDLDGLRQSAFLSQSTDPKAKIRPDVTLDGVEAYHLAGPIGNGRWTHIVGTVHEGISVRLTIDYDSDTTPAEREEIFASMLASFRWK